MALTVLKKGWALRLTLLLLMALCFCVALSGPAWAKENQGPEVEWEKTFGGSSYDGGFSVQQTADGGYIIVDSTSSYSVGENDVWLIKTDTQGNKIWDKTFGGADWELGYSVQQTTDGGYIILGGIHSYEVRDDIYLIKTDGRGNKLWDKTFDRSNNEDTGYSVQQTTDGGYIIAGKSWSGARNADIWLIKTDAQGNKLWDKTFGGLSWDGDCSVQQTTDGGYIVAGGIDSIDFYGTVLVKTDAQGNKLWEQVLLDVNIVSRSVQQTADGGYIVAGGTCLIKTDAQGNKLWKRTLSCSDDIWGCSVQQTTDGGYITVGETTSLIKVSKGNSWNMRQNLLLIRTNTQGNELWRKTFFLREIPAASGDVRYWNYSVQQTSDGGYIVGTGTCLIKIKPEIKVYVDQKLLSFPVPPVVENGVTLVPLRAIFEALGAEVKWDGATQTVTAVKGGTTIKLTVGSKVAYKNSVPVTLDVPAQIKNGRTFVPLRFVSEALGAEVKWDAKTSTVIITTYITSQPTKEDLVQELKGLEQAMLDKIDGDIEVTATAFTEVKDYWRSRRWADILTAPLRVIEDTISILAKAADLKDAVEQADTAFSSSEGTYQVLTTVMMLHDLQVTGERLAWGLDGPTYASSVENMLAAADATFVPLSGDNWQEYYEKTIKNYLYGSAQGSPLRIPHYTTTPQRKTVAVAKGALEVRSSIASDFNDLISKIEKQELPKDFPLDDVIAQIKELKTQIIKSRISETDVRYKAYLQGNETYAETTLGTPASFYRAFGQVAGMVDKKLAIEQRVEVLKAVEAGTNATLLYTITYKIPGLEDLKVLQKSTVLSEIITKPYTSTFYSDPEKEFYLLPQEMVLSLPVELSNLWMVADDTSRYLRHLWGESL